MAHGLERIDWSAPWLAPYRAIGQPLAQQVCRGASVAQALNHAVSSDWLPEFVPQEVLGDGVGYEPFIFEHRRVPTRDGLHDFFNGLIWLHFPKTKARLNALQAQQIARDGVQAQRGKLRDALTLIDENAAILIAPRDLWQALLAQDWTSVFTTQRELWVKPETQGQAYPQAQLILLGHALLEKLVSPRKAITAHVLVVPDWQPIPTPPHASTLAALDIQLAQRLQAPWVLSKPLTPLPVLGVPGWWPANEDPAFYDDNQVFRPKRAKLVKQKPD